MKHATIIAAALLSGCAIFSPPPGTQLGDTWVKRHDALPYVWEVVPYPPLNPSPRPITDAYTSIAARCSFKYEHPNNACAIRLRDGPNGPYCLILSHMTEAEARHVYLRTPTGAIRTLNGKPETLADHERKHCDGFDHLEAK